ncbi:MAG: hypothetical protein AAF215_07545 [Cyanobacteria bacterium P01_A01_bin.123]
MFTIDVTLQNTPLTLSVQKKEASAAQALYKSLLEAMRTKSPEMLELACDQQNEKKIALLSNQIAAVQIYEKSGTSAASGKPPGFFSMVNE